MAISKDLLDILVCPADKAELEMKPDQSGLKCVQCKRVYPIRDDIPVMLIDEAKVDAARGEPTGGRRHQPREGVEERGLAGAVRTDDADQCPRLDLEGDPVDGD